jgi:crotonobetainyl-CoA:carnitine CoA-transferase CaiB-like acyl-CoA transferase
MKRRQLDGIRVLDMTRVLAGPLSAQMLGDLGAEVIKVEHPGRGDESRVYGPPFFDPQAPRDRVESAIYLCANRNKKGITVDFTQPEGRQILRDLAAKSDVVIENFRVGTLAKYGLDYASLRALNPGIVYCSITGYGQTGPSRLRSGYDAIFQAEGGLMHSIGYPDDHPAAGPLRVGLSIVDVMASLYADIAIIGALYNRDARGGTGEHVDISLLESCLGVMTHHAEHFLISGELPVRRGNTAGGGGVPSGLFNCADGDIVITVGNDQQFGRFCLQVLERPDIAADACFATNQARVHNRDLIRQVLNDIFQTQPMQYWIDRMVQADLSVGQVSNLRDVFANPQVQARGAEVRVPHPNGSELRLVGNPIHYVENPIETYMAPPALGEHTEEIMTRLLGRTAEDVAALRAKGVV